MKIWGGPCPNCKSNDTEINYLEYEIPDIGNVLIYSFLCRNCNLRYSDIIPQSINFNEYEITIKGVEDFYKRIYKIPGFKIIIKEVDIEITNVSSSKFMVYTVDGFLQEVIEILKNVKDKSLENKETIEEKINYLNGVLEGKNKLTIVIKKSIS